MCLRYNTGQSNTRCMRLVVSPLFALSITPAIFAQGLVNFANTPSTPVYTQAYVYQGSFSIMSAPRETFYFGLFLGHPSLGYAFTGIYATNTGVDGLFSGGVVAVPGWAPGTSTNYFVAGWDMGHDFRPEWLNGFGIIGEFGTSSLGSGVAGNGTSIPPLNLFNGGGNTLRDGFPLFNHLVPEPSTTLIATVGTGLILVYRTRARKKKGLRD